MKKFFILILFLLIPQSLFAEKLSLYEQKLVEKVKDVFDTEKRPVLDLPVCATPIFLEVLAVKDKLSPQAKKILEPYTSRPGEDWDPHKTLDSPSGHFKIHYTTEGLDSVYQKDVDFDGNGVPDYVDSCAKILDYAWSFEVDSLGYISPPSDSFYPPGNDNGGDEKYDVYLVNIRKGYFGYTQAELPCDGSDRRYTSFIVLRNDYSYYSDSLGLYENVYEPLSVTSAHEFFHSIHFGYDTFEGDMDGGEFKPYWMEISAVWMEDQVFDEVDDYLHYLHWFYRFPWLSLKTFSTEPQNIPGLYHPYASCVWAFFLSERFDDLDIIKKIWEKCGEIKGDNAIEATGEVLADPLYKSSFDDAFREFTVWNYFIGGRAIPTKFYSEGGLFIDSAGKPLEIKVQDSFSSYPVDSSSTFYPPQTLGTNYILFYPLSDSGGLKTDFNGADQAKWKTSLVGHHKDYIPTEVEFELNSSQDGVAQIDNWTNYEEIILIPSVVSFADGIRTHHYEYKARHDSSLHGEISYQPWVRTVPYKDKYLAFIGEDFTLNVKATDQNIGDTLTIEKSGVGNFGIDNVLVGLSPLSGSFNWRPTEDFLLDSLYEVTFTVFDPGGLSDTAFVQILLKEKPKKDIAFQNCPNPFIISKYKKTYFPFELSFESTVKITIFTVAGELVKKLPESKEFSFGYHSCENRRALPFWDGTNENGEKVSSGVYLYHVKTKNASILKKMVVLR